MSTITLRSVKGSPLTNAEVDANFSNLNTDKLEIADAVSTNTASKVVRRDSSGNFSAGTITATLVGSATSAGVATNLAGGANGSIPYQTGSGATSLLALGTTGQVLTSTGSGLVWLSPTIPAGYTAGSSSVGFIAYNGVTPSAGQYDGSSTAPSGTTRLNYNGYLYATKFVGDGSSLTSVSASTSTAATNLAGGAAGSVPYQTGSGATSFLSAGTAGQVLTSNGSSGIVWGDAITLLENKRSLTASTSTTGIDLNTGDKATVFKMTVAANTTLTFSNPPSMAGGETFSFTLMTVNDSTAGRAISFGNTIKWAGGTLPPRTTSANAVDIWTFFIENGVYYGSLSIADAK